MGCGASSEKARGVAADVEVQPPQESPGGSHASPAKLQKTSECGAEQGTSRDIVVDAPVSKAPSSSSPPSISPPESARPASAKAAPSPERPPSAKAASQPARPPSAKAAPAVEAAAAIITVSPSPPPVHPPVRPPSAKIPPSTEPTSAPPARPASAPATRPAAPAAPTPAPAPTSAPAPAPASAPATKPVPQVPAAAAAAAKDTTARPALQMRRLEGGLLGDTCLGAQAGGEGEPGGMQFADLSDFEAIYIGCLRGDDLESKCIGAVCVSQLLCSATAPMAGVVASELVAPLVSVLKEGPPLVKREAACALGNLATGGYAAAEAVTDASAAEVLVSLAQQQHSGEEAEGLQEMALWALGNIAGALHPALKTQALAAEVMDCGALKAVLSVLEAQPEAAPLPDDAPPPPPPSLGSAQSSSLLRCAAWCLHNLAKHKREKDMVNAIPLVTSLLLRCADPEVLTCCAWVLAYLGSNEENATHMRQVLPALPRLVEWVSDASSSLATPSLLCLGTLCTGYMQALDYSGDVVKAGGVPAMLSYLKKAAMAGRRDGVKEALFALSNVAGGNNGTVRAMLDAGAFGVVLKLTRAAGDDEEVRTECLYVLTNPWDPLVGVEVATSQGLVSSGILEQLHELLVPEAPPLRLTLLLKGLGDGLKRGQQLMTHAANMQLVEHGRDGAAALPRPTNPVVDLYVSLGTVGRIEELNSHADVEVSEKAHGILTVLKFFMS